MSKETKITFCPNCNQPAFRVGDEITCENCDAIFTITQKQEPKVKELGRIEKLEKDFAELKAKIVGKETPIENPSGSNNSEKDDEGEDILPP